MKTPKRRRGDMRELCALPAEGDGIDPREDHRAAHRSANPSSDPSNHQIDRKMLQLCKQVQRAVEAALCCCGDPLLSSLQIAGSRPVAGGTGIELLVHCLASSDAARIAASLAKVRSMLRCEVARCITRKKVPVLSFRLQLQPSQGTHS